MIKHLDCTLRDGGYYNSWDFEPQLVKEYLNTMSEIQIDYCEIGFRSIINKGFKGPYAFSTDEFLEEIKIPKKLENKIGVMINGKEISDPSSQLKILKQLFKPSNESPVSLVRIACHFEEYEKCLPAVEWLKSKGYTVGMNIMQANTDRLKEFEYLSKISTNYPIDVLYFADSMGCLDPTQVTEIINSIRQSWEGELGVHTHDNLGLSITNTLRGIENGATWVDSTVTGMGRGPGNAQTEFLILELGKENINLSVLLELINKHFNQLKSSYHWGKNPYYYLAGRHKIHPTYIQNMLQDVRFSEKDILTVIEHLKNTNSQRYTREKLESTQSIYPNTPNGNWPPQNALKGKDVLLIGTGPSSRKYKKAIEQFIGNKQLTVLALNSFESIDEELIDYRIACNPERIYADFKGYCKPNQKLITPLSALPNEFQRILNKENVLDFGIINDGINFQPSKHSVHMTSTLVFQYALGIIISGEVNRVFLAGFDGYPNGDPRNDESKRIIQDYYNYDERAVELISITPTYYDIKKESVFFKLNDED